MFARILSVFTSLRDRIRNWWYPPKPKVEMQKHWPAQQAITYIH